MEAKKRMIILVILAVVLAITAVVLNVVDSNVSTTANVVSISSGDGNVGIDIKLGEVEDKLVGNSGGVQS